jgi:hypothetical protein
MKKKPAKHRINGIEMTDKELDEKIQNLLTEEAKPENVIARRIKYRPFREMIIFTVCAIMKKGFITLGDVEKRFGFTAGWASIKLRDLTYLELLIKVNEREYRTVFRPILDKDGEPKIYQYYDRCKNWEPIW